MAGRGERRPLPFVAGARETDVAALASFASLRVRQYDFPNY